MLIKVTMTERAIVADEYKNSVDRPAVVNSNHIVSATPHKVIKADLTQKPWWCTKLVLRSNPSTILYVMEPVEYFISPNEFKNYVHKFLDDHGVPHDPDPHHTARHGCRIQGRLQYLVDKKAE
jgi:hypothetical protein